MKTIKSFLVGINLLFLPLALFAYQQQYITAAPQTKTHIQPQRQSSLQPIKSNLAQTNNSMNIYMAPAATPQPQAQAEPRQFAQVQQQILQQQTQPQPVTKPVTRNTIPQARAAQTGAYTQQEKAAWFRSCLPAVKNRKVAPYANEFCACGWQQIASGKVPEEYLTSSNPEEIKKANRLLSVISQECLAQVVGTHKIY